MLERLLIAVVLGGSIGCVTTSRPGHYDPSDPAVAARRSTLTARAARFEHREGYESLTRELDASFGEHVQGAGLFAKIVERGSAEPADVELHGSIGHVCQPTTVFNADYSCHDYHSFGYSGMQVLIAGITLGAWPALSIFGVPTDGARGSAELTIWVRDPVSGVDLASFGSGVIEETAYAGLYYSGSPLGEALRAAAGLVLLSLEQSLPALEERVQKIRAWKEACSPLEALASPDAAIRARGLIALAEGRTVSAIAGVAALAKDPDPIVRLQTVKTLVALGARDPAGKGALAVLAEDGDQRIANAARLGTRNLRIAAIAEQAGDQRLSKAIDALAVPDTRKGAHQELRALGPAARPAIDALLLLIGEVSFEDQRDIVQTVLAIGYLDDRVEAMLADRAKSGIGEAQLAIAQLAAAREKQAEAPPPPPPAPVAEAPQPGAIVAVFTIDATMLRPADRSTLTDLFATLLTSVGGYRVVPRDAIKKRLAESKLASYRACVDETCQIEIGKALAAEKVVSTKIIRSEKQCVLTATLYDLRTETTERAAIAKSRCQTSELTQAMSALAEGIKAAR